PTFALRAGVFGEARPHRKYQQLNCALDWSTMNRFGNACCGAEPAIPLDSGGGRRSTPSKHSKSWLFASAAQNFAINCINRHLCTIFADPDGVALGSSLHLCK